MADQLKAIQGTTLRGLIVDEVVLLSQDIFNMSLSRLSEEGAKMWATYNPASPQHWFKRDVVDELDKLDCEHIHFTMDDNPSLSDEIKQRYERSFSGSLEESDIIDGEWAGPAMGASTQRGNDGDMEPTAANKPTLALDWGISNRFACLMVKAKTVVAEYVHDSDKEGYRTEGEHRDAIVAWVAQLHGEPQGIKVWVDPSPHRRHSNGNCEK